MGYSIPLMIHNDGAEELLRDPKLGEKLVDAIREADHTNKRVDVAVGSHANLIQVLPMHHADDARYYKVDGNLMKEVPRSGMGGKGKVKKHGLRTSAVSRFRYKGTSEWRPVGESWWRLQAAIRQGRPIEVQLRDGEIVSDPEWSE